MLIYSILTLSAHVREGYIVSLSVCLSVCLSDFEDGGVFTFENGYQHELGDDLSLLNVEKRPYLGEKN